MNELYELVLVRPIHKLSVFLWRIVDVILIDGLILMSARITKSTGQLARGVQSGVLEHYLMVMVLGLSVLGYDCFGYFLIGV